MFNCKASHQFLSPQGINCQIQQKSFPSCSWTRFNWVLWGPKNLDENLDGHVWRGGGGKEQKAMKRPFGSNFKYSCRRPSKEAVWRGKRYSHSNCYRAILLTHPQLHSPQTSHSHTIIVQAGSFTGKVITLCLPRHVRTPRCAEGEKADSEENAVHLTVSSRLQLRPNFSLFPFFWSEN